jgi:hypothetical protein
MGFEAALFDGQYHEVDEKPVAVDSGCRNCASSSSGGTQFGITAAGRAKGSGF